MQHAAQQRAEDSVFAGCFPHNIEAEQSLLGAILINNQAYSLVARLVEIEHFFEPIRGRIYATARGLIQAGRLATPFTLKDYLPADLDIAGMSLDRYLARLCAEATTVVNAPDYAKTIRDLAHRRTMIAIAEELRASAALSPVDFSPDMLAQQTIERLYEIVTARTETHLSDRLRPLDLKQFLQLSVKSREMILGPILPEKGLAMLYAGRGTGKTLVALGIAFAVASGTKFLKWTAPKARRVLLIDGEMPAANLQDRLENIVAGAPDVNLDPDNLKILAADLIETGGIGNLASREVQSELDQWLDGVDLLILDNLSCLTAVVRDNDAESWGPIQEWLLKLRRGGISVLIVHHAGKGGQQRGTSRRADVLDTVISLRRPVDYTAAEGARFEVHLEKARGVYGDAAKPFEAKLECHDGSSMWTVRELEDADRQRVHALLGDGLSVRDIADETGIPKSTVHRIKKAIEAEAGVTNVM
jgi:uncharacterized protein YerC